MQGEAVRHIRVINTVDGGHVLTQGDEPCTSVWELIHQQMDTALTNTHNTMVRLFWLGDGRQTVPPPAPLPPFTALMALITCRFLSMHTPPQLSGRRRIGVLT